MTVGKYQMIMIGNIFFKGGVYKKKSACNINNAEGKPRTHKWGISSIGRAPALHAGG